MWGAEEGGKAEEVGEDARCGYLGAGAGTAHDHGLGVVACGLETHDVVAAGQMCEGMIERVAAHPG